jgi:hypothetical protein
MKPLRPGALLIAAATISPLIVATAATLPAAAAAAPTTADQTANSIFTPESPAVRILDTRTANGGGAIAANATRVLTIPNVPAGATAVALNITAVNSTAAGFLTVWPDGTPSPGTSSLDFPANQTVANMDIVPLGTNNSIDIFNHAGVTNVLTDVSGFYNSGVAGSYNAVGPTRILDTRNGTGLRGGVPAQLVGNTALKLQVQGVASVPTIGVSAVVINLTATGSNFGSYFTAYPDAATRPNFSTMNFQSGQTISNLTVVPVTDGLIDIWNQAGETDVVADIIGYYSTGAGGTYTAVGPFVLLNTRNGIGTSGVVAPIDADDPNTHGVLTVQAAGIDGVPTNVTAVVLHIAVADGSAGGSVTVYPANITQPATSNIDFATGDVVSNLVIVPVDVNGNIDICNHFGTVNIVANVLGYYQISP